MLFCKGLLIWCFSFYLQYLQFCAIFLNHDLQDLRIWGIPFCWGLECLGKGLLWGKDTVWRGRIPNKDIHIFSGAMMGLGLFRQLGDNARLSNFTAIGRCSELLLRQYDVSVVILDTIYL